MKVFDLLKLQDIICLSLNYAMILLRVMATLCQIGAYTSMSSSFNYWKIFFWN